MVVDVCCILLKFLVHCFGNEKLQQRWGWSDPTPLAHINNSYLPDVVLQVQNFLGVLK